MSEASLKADLLQNELNYRRGSRILHALTKESLITPEEARIQATLLEKYPPYLCSLWPKKLDMTGF